MLNLPAKRFFIYLKRLREQEYRSQCAEYLNLCDIAAIPSGGSEYYRKLKEAFMKEAIPPENRRDKAIKAEDPFAARMIASMLKTKKRLSRGQ